MHWINPINPHRFETTLSLVTQDHALAHVLDRLIYRCQQGDQNAQGQPAFTVSLEALVAFVGQPSVRALQRALKALEKRGLITRTITFTGRYKQSVIALTSRVMEALPTSADNDTLPVMWQAETLYRYDALTQLIQPPTGKVGTVWMMVLNQLLYLMLREAKRTGQGIEAAESCQLACILPQLAKRCHLSVRTLQRVLAALEMGGWITKSKKRVGGPYVETRYRVSVLIWETLRHAKGKKPSHIVERSSTQKPVAKPTIRQDSGVALRDLDDVSALSAPQSDKVVQQLAAPVQKLRHVETGQFNMNIDINIYNNNNTARARETMVCRPALCNVNEKNKKIKEDAKRTKGNATPISDYALDTPMGLEIALNPRQIRYVRGTLARLNAQHACQFSDPNGLFHEICFALRQVDHIFPGRLQFRHRLNLIAKLLREKRWTTPYGYERYDARGRAQKQRREAKEQQWQQEKARETGAATATALLTLEAPLTGEKRLGQTQRLSSVLGTHTPPRAVTERLKEMQGLAQRANAADCSQSAREAIIELLHAHQAAIQSHLAKEA